jgi:hypothetical protein
MDQLAVTVCTTALTLGSVITVRWLLAKAEVNRFGDSASDEAKRITAPLSEPSLTKRLSAAKSAFFNPHP